MTNFNPLSPDLVASNSSSFIFPPGWMGVVRLGVRVDPFLQVAERDEVTNNLAWTSTFFLSVALAVQGAFPQEVREDAQTPEIPIRLQRTGNTNTILSVGVTLGDPPHVNEMEVPTNLTFAVGEVEKTLAVRVRRDGISDGDQDVVINLWPTNQSYEPRTQVMLRVVDVDLGLLSLSFDAASLQEGRTLSASIMRSYVTTNAITVRFRSSDPTQLSVPESVVIPPNSSSITFAVLALDDSVLELPQTVLVTASVDRFTDASAQLRIDDDDIPSLTLELTSSSVSEGAGPNATTATLRRAVAKPFPVTVQMTSSEPSAARVPISITIEANRDAVSFPVAAVDDDQVDGPQQTVLRASLAIGNPPVLVAESQPLTLVVTDDDGPTLTLRVAKDMLGEGLDPATTVTVTRNTGNSGSLEVALSTSDLAEAVLPASVTIPDGTNAVTVPLRTVLDGVTDGNKTVTLTAAAPGFTAGQATVVVTDIDLPDLVVLSANVPASSETGAELSVPVVIRNQGLAATTNSFVQRLFLSTDPLMGSDVLVTQASFNGSLGADQTNQQSLTLTLPQNPGTYWLIVQADAGDTIHESLENNNYFVSKNAIQVQASYRATVNVTQAILVGGTPVTITGQAFATGSGAPAGLVRLNIHIVLNGTVRIMAVTTDASGRFSTVFQPLPGEGGSYTVMVAYPGVPMPVDDGLGNTTRFTLLAMRLETPPAEQSLIEQIPWPTRLRIVNLAPLPLHNLRAEVVSKPDALNVTSLAVEGGGTLASLGETFVNLQAVVTDAAIPRGELQLRLTTDEGVEAFGTIRFHVSRQRANLFADVSRLESSVVRTNQRTVQFALGNNGMTASGDITLLFPPVAWMSSPQGQVLPSLAPGETRSVSLSLTPDQTVALTEHRGSIVLSSATSQLALPFSFRVVSDALADLAVTTVDEYFYFAEGKPKLSGVLVRLLDPFSGAELRRSMSDTNGLAQFTSLMEGAYTLEASAPDHSGYRNTVFIQPGGLNERQVFLSRETVRYIWTVETTEIPERSNIIVQTRFEANVPAPVIVVEPTVINIASLTVPRQQMQVNVKISNQGLIAWQGVKFGFDANPNFEVKPLIEDIGTLAAHGELVVPVTITRLGRRLLRLR